MEERFKQLRKSLGLTQEEFGARIGIKASAVGQIEKKRNKLSARNVDAICNVFNVRKEWLEDGEGEIFNAPKAQTFLEMLAEEKGLDSREIALLQSIIDLPASVRGAVIDWALDLARRVNGEEETPEEKELREIERQQRKLEERKAELTGCLTGEKSRNAVG